MSTRSMIGKVGRNGKVTAVYCHFDGYLSGVGLELITHFNSATKARELLKEGALRCIENGEFTSYHGWRGEKIEIEKYESITEYGERCKDDCSTEYTYLFVTNLGWLVMADNGTWSSLVPSMCTHLEEEWNEINGRGAK